MLLLAHRVVSSQYRLRPGGSYPNDECWKTRLTNGTWPANGWSENEQNEKRLIVQE
jgi:hypothetical protein